MLGLLTTLLTPFAESDKFELTSLIVLLNLLTAFKSPKLLYLGSGAAGYVINPIPPNILNGKLNSISNIFTKNFNILTRKSKILAMNANIGLNGETINDNTLPIGEKIGFSTLSAIKSTKIFAIFFNTLRTGDNTPLRIAVNIFLTALIIKSKKGSIFGLSDILTIYIFYKKIINIVKKFLNNYFSKYNIKSKN